ncbi:MAG: hypothetical protein EPN26_11215 [Rhodospirillales bacterium]|nr:MAG: hypothetical protein EPN26_11215 [Rhodospirillales bacterium]
MTSLLEALPRATCNHIEFPSLLSGEAIRKAGREARCGSSGERRNDAGARQKATPWGRVILMRGFVEWLARSATTRGALLLPTHQNLSGEGIPI